MKKKLGMLTIAAALVAIFAGSVKADTESTDSNSSGGGKCEEPWSNTCYKVKQKDGTYSTKKGVLHVRA